MVSWRGRFARILRDAASGACAWRASVGQSEFLFGYAEQPEDLALEVGQFGVEDLHGLIAVQEDAALRVVE